MKLRKTNSNSKKDSQCQRASAYALSEYPSAPALANVLFPSSKRDEVRGNVVTKKFALLTLGFSNTSQIVKNANPTALRSKNVVTMRSPPPKVCQQSHRLHLCALLLWDVRLVVPRRARSNISKAYDVSGTTKNQRRRTLTCSIL